MSLTEQQLEEVSLAIHETLKIERFIKWLPTVICVAGIVGGSYVTLYRVGLAEESLQGKADKETVDNVVVNTDLKLKVIQNDVDNIKDDVGDIKKTQSQILRELRQSNRGGPNID